MNLIFALLSNDLFQGVCCLLSIFLAWWYGTKTERKINAELKQQRKISKKAQKLKQKVKTIQNYSGEDSYKYITHDISSTLMYAIFCICMASGACIFLWSLFPTSEMLLFAARIIGSVLMGIAIVCWQDLSNLSSARFPEKTIKKLIEKINILSDKNSGDEENSDDK
ncbi:MAG: hypothetical protein OXE99_06745 [Cellvibrionales bacterium]|nr:hypothetical protein [Cellvibrionales bacterium]